MKTCKLCGQQYNLVHVCLPDLTRFTPEELRRFLEQLTPEELEQLHEQVC